MVTSTLASPEAPTRTVRIAREGDSDWDELRAAFNVLVDLRPAAIAVPTSVDEVQQAVRHARLHGMTITAQATGHGAASLSDLSDTLLVSTAGLREVEIDAARRRVRVGTGVRWADVTPELSALGLAALHGSSQDVGIAGYSLGGGIGWLARRHGMQTNAVRAIELVLADGRFVRTDADSEPELFWALRGGNGNYGVVTAIEFEVVPVTELYAGALFFPIERTGEVLRTWTSVLGSLPEELTTWVTLLHLPPTPDVPEPVRGQSFAIVMGVHLGSEADGRSSLRPLRDLGPVLDTFAMCSPADIGSLAMDPESPLPFRSTTALLDSLPPAAIDEIATVSARGSALTMVQLRHGGGALARVPRGAGARATLAGEIIMFALGVAPDAAVEAEVHAALARVDDIVAPYAVGAYPNFVERPADLSAYVDAATWGRLRAVKSVYDPSEVMRGNHRIPRSDG